MRIGIISDVHGNDIALKAVIDNFKKESVDGVIFLGDLVAGGPNPRKALDLLKNLKVVCWIKGNTDSKYEEVIRFSKLENKRNTELPKYYSYALKELSYQDLEFLINKPIQESITLEGLDILCVHGSPRNVMEKMGKEVEQTKLIEMIEGVKENIVLCGHSHLPSMVEVNEKVIVNAGSVGFPVDGNNKSSYVILDINEKGYNFYFKRVEYNIEKVIYDARVKELPNFEKYQKVIKSGIYN